jgi:hypothetical protein
MKKIARRKFITTGGSLLLAYPLLNFSPFKVQQTQRNRILLRTGWGTDTFGDLASIPAAYRSIQRYVPNTEVYIWPDKMNDDLRALLEKNFTQLKMVTGEISKSGQPDTTELKEAFDNANMFVYTPGARKKIDWSGLGNGNETESISYCQNTGLPYVIYGLGDIPDDPDEQPAFIKKVNGAALAFVTESASEEKIKNLKTKIENLQSGPDPLFGFDLKDDTAARHFLDNKGLSYQNFIVMNIRNGEFSDAGNNKPGERLVFLLENWMSATRHLILLVADTEEDMDAVKKIHENLPDEMKTKIILYDGPLAPDLLSSIYEKSRITAAMSAYPLTSALLSDIPVFHFNDLSLDSTGQIFVDLGLKHYVADTRNNSKEKLLEMLFEINKSYVKALLDINKAHKEVTKQLEQSFGDIHKLLVKINPPPKKKEQKKK